MGRKKRAEVYQLQQIYFRWIITKIREISGFKNRLKNRFKKSKATFSKQKTKQQQQQQQQQQKQKIKTKQKNNNCLSQFQAFMLL